MRRPEPAKPALRRRERERDPGAARSPRSACRRRPGGRRSRARPSARRASACRSRPERAADQALDLDRAALLLAGAGLAADAAAGRGREHPVLGRQPAPPAARRASAARRPRPWPCRGRASAERDERRAVRPARGSRVTTRDGTQLVRCRRRPLAVIDRSGGSPARARRAATVAATSPIGSCRKRSPSARELLRRARRQEAARALARDVVADPLRASVSATSRAVSSAEKTSVVAAPEDALEDGPDQRVVRAAEDHRVDARVLERRGVLAHGRDELLGRRRRPRSAGRASGRRPRRPTRPRRAPG